ncbi:MAG: phosphatidate cytidylyltransferase [Hyphomicrobiales bacterium]
MTEPGSAAAPAKGKSELFLRVVSALVLAPIALGVTWAGGAAFGLFMIVLAVAVFYEWATVSGHDARHPETLAGYGGVAAIVFIAALGEVDMALVFIAALAAASVGLWLSGGRLRWHAAGMLYASLIGVALVALRADEGYGLLAVVWIFFVVWATDILAYFVGRSVGGPKLWPRVSPKKTWSGFLGGLAAAIVFGVLVAHYGGVVRLWPVGLAAAVLSVVAQEATFWNPPSSGISGSRI